MYKNVWISTTYVPGEEPTTVSFPEASVFGFTMTGYLAVKVGNSWYNYSSDNVVAYGCEVEEDTSETDETNVVRLQ